MKILRYWLFATSVVVVAACGGSGSGLVGGDPIIGPIVDESPGGIWVGTTVSDVTPELLVTLGVITETGEARFINENGTQIFGTVSTAGSVLSGDLTGVTALGFVWPDATAVATITVEGLVEERMSLSGDYSGGGDMGSFSLEFDPIYDRDSSLANVEGTWVQLDGLLNIFATFVIDADGTVNGTDITGCVYSGAVSIIDSEFNVYDVAVDVANCTGVDAIFNGSYNGVGVLSDDVPGSEASDVFTVGVNSESIVITNVLDKL